jgi:hypothetical protein
MLCNHAACSCQVLDGSQFCGDNCRAGAGSGAFCSCEHAECEASLAG